MTTVYESIVEDASSFLSFEVLEEGKSGVEVTESFAIRTIERVQIRKDEFGLSKIVVYWKRTQESYTTTFSVSQEVAREVQEFMGKLGSGIDVNRRVS